jgi:hypothetical protein
MLASRNPQRKRFECRERLTEICIALQGLELPAWVTVQILDAARPWSTLPLRSNLVSNVQSPFPIEMGSISPIVTLQSLSLAFC